MKKSSTMSREKNRPEVCAGSECVCVHVHVYDSM